MGLGVSRIMNKDSFGSHQGFQPIPGVDTKGVPGGSRLLNASTQELAIRSGRSKQRMGFATASTSRSQCKPENGTGQASPGRVQWRV